MASYPPGCPCRTIARRTPRPRRRCSAPGNDGARRSEPAAAPIGDRVRRWQACNGTMLVPVTWTASTQHAAASPSVTASGRRHGCPGARHGGRVLAVPKLHRVPPRAHDLTGSAYPGQRGLLAWHAADVDVHVASPSLGGSVGRGRGSAGSRSSLSGSLHHWDGLASPYSSCHFHHAYGAVWG